MPVGPARASGNCSEADVQAALTVKGDTGITCAHKTLAVGIVSVVVACPGCPECRKRIGSMIALAVGVSFGHQFSGCGSYHRPGAAEAPVTPARISPARICWGPPC